MAEIDLAQELAERSDAAIATAVKKFLDEKFTEFDTALAPVTAGLPADRQARQLPDTSNDEVIGWAASSVRLNSTRHREKRLLSRAYAIIALSTIST